jgi:hypothetical protein
MRFTALVCCFLSGCPFVHAQSPNLTDNLKYRVSWGDLGPVKAAPLVTHRALRLAEGSDQLLADCLANPAKWHKDPLIYRFGHRNAFTTIGCRERSAPSLHVVFYKQPDGSRQAWIHFDRYKPGNLVGHSAEVIQNRLTVGRTSQADIYRALVVERNDSHTPVPPRHYDVDEQFHEYLKNTYSAGPLLSAVATGGVSGLLDGTSIFGDGFERYSNHMEANLIRHVTQQTLEFGVAAALQQNERFLVSHDERMTKRIKAALYHSFFVAGRDGNEFAFPRLAAAVGTGVMITEWHPWRDDHVSTTREVSSILGGYVARSFWQEFKPDIKHELRTEKRKLLRQPTDDHMIALSGPVATNATTCSEHCK